ncbi:hypothetical protein FACS189421_02300 [Bacteroidia bacterium]|nr:hypothetical protein FACS189421_02300 [Bacteroidia bacterium]
MRNQLDEQKHYQSSARYYTNLSILKRGHNLFSLCNSIGKDVCNKILEAEKFKLAGDSGKIGALYRAKKDFNKEITQNLQFGAYPEIEKIEDDMLKYKAM